MRRFLPRRRVLPQSSVPSSASGNAQGVRALPEALVEGKEPWGWRMCPSTHSLPRPSGLGLRKKIAEPRKGISSRLAADGTRGGNKPIYLRNLRMGPKEEQTTYLQNVYGLLLLSVCLPLRASPVERVSAPEGRPVDFLSGAPDAPPKSAPKSPY